MTAHANFIQQLNDSYEKVPQGEGEDLQMVMVSNRHTNEQAALIWSELVTASGGSDTGVSLANVFSMAEMTLSGTETFHVARGTDAEPVEVEGAIDRFMVFPNDQIIVSKEQFGARRLA